MHAITLISAVLTTGLCAGLLAGVSAEQQSKSAPLARQLAQLLDAAKIDSIGAPDPSTGGFVAALYIPGTQLLVVGGKFATPEIGPYRLSKKEFRELYMDLMGGSVAGSKMFAQDVSADGLVFKPDGDAPADSWERGTEQRTFAGAKKAKLKDEEYTKAFSDADTEYSRLLSLLIDQCKNRGS
jgi:hypothetical protein